MSGLRVAVDARPLDIDYLRAQGIGRYAHGLLGPLAEVAAEHGGQLTALRAAGVRDSPFGVTPGARPRTVEVRRPPFPARYADLLEQVALPVTLRGAGAQVHHSLSIYRAPVLALRPHVMTMHDVVPLMWPERYLRTGLIHKLLYRAAQRADLLLAVSEAARRDTIAHLGIDPEKVECVPEAADERFTPSDAAKIRDRLGLAGPYVVWVGGLATHDPRKNLEGLVTSFASWQREAGRTETLVLAGGLGPAGRELRALAARTGARIAFPGFVPDPELPALYSGARCMVTASRYEGFGLPALEAISCATPVVAFDVGAVPEVAGAGALTVRDGDLRALMAAVARVCDEPELHARLRAGGLAHAEGYSWRRTAQLTWRAYERVAR
ncbi:MAG: glycosyltransferase family 4 protein [Thermoleophilaceae bacterium]